MAVRWRKSSRSGNGGDSCVELGWPDGAPAPAAVRDSKNPTGPALSVDPARLVEAVKAGRLG